MFPDLFENITHETFRSKNNPSLLADLYPRWMVHTGKGINGGEDGGYFRTSDNNFWKIGDSFSTMPFFCINDTHDNCDLSDPLLLSIEETLEKLFPEKSSFEK